MPQRTTKKRPATLQEAYDKLQWDSAIAKLLGVTIVVRHTLTPNPFHSERVVEIKEQEALEELNKIPAHYKSSHVILDPNQTDDISAGLLILNDTDNITPQEILEKFLVGHSFVSEINVLKKLTKGKMLNLYKDANSKTKEISSLRIQRQNKIIYVKLTYQTSQKHKIKTASYAEVQQDDINQQTKELITQPAMQQIDDNIIGRLNLAIETKILRAFYGICLNPFILMLLGVTSYAIYSIFPEGETDYSVSDETKYEIFYTIMTFIAGAILAHLSRLPLKTLLLGTPPEQQVKLNEKNNRKKKTSIPEKHQSLHLHIDCPKGIEVSPIQKNENSQTSVSLKISIKVILEQTEIPRKFYIEKLKEANSSNHDLSLELKEAKIIATADNPEILNKNLKLLLKATKADISNSARSYAIEQTKTLLNPYCEFTKDNENSPTLTIGEMRADYVWLSPKELKKLLLKTDPIYHQDDSTGELYIDSGQALQNYLERKTPSHHSPDSSNSTAENTPQEKLKEWVREKKKNKIIHNITRVIKETDQSLKTSSNHLVKITSKKKSIQVTIQLTFDYTPSAKNSQLVANTSLIPTASTTGSEDPIIQNAKLFQKKLLENIQLTTQPRKPGSESEPESKSGSKLTIQSNEVTYTTDGLKITTALVITVKSQGELNALLSEPDLSKIKHFHCSSNSTTQAANTKSNTTTRSTPANPVPNTINEGSKPRMKARTQQKKPRTPPVEKSFTEVQQNILFTAGLIITQARKAGAAEDKNKNQPLAFFHYYVQILSLYANLENNKAIKNLRNHVVGHTGEETEATSEIMGKIHSIVHDYDEKNPRNNQEPYNLFLKLTKPIHSEFHMYSLGKTNEKNSNPNRTEQQALKRLLNLIPILYANLSDYLNNPQKQSYQNICTANFYITLCQMRKILQRLSDETRSKVKNTLGRKFSDFITNYGNKFFHPESTLADDVALMTKGEGREGEAEIFAEMYRHRMTLFSIPGNKGQLDKEESQQCLVNNFQNFVEEHRQTYCTT